MKIDNFKSAGKITLILPVMLLISVILIVYPFVDNIINKDSWIIAGGLLFLFYLIIFLSRPHYFYFEPKHKSIIIRFYNPHPLFIRRSAFEVLYSDFVKYEITSTLGGYRKNLILHIKQGKKVGKYPSVSVTLLNKKQMSDLKKELNTILKIKSLK